MTCQEFLTSEVLHVDEKKPTQGGQTLLTNKEFVAVLLSQVCQLGRVSSYYRIRTSALLTPVTVVAGRLTNFEASSNLSALA